MLRIFRGERLAADGATPTNEQEAQNTISLTSDASRPTDSTPAATAGPHASEPPLSEPQPPTAPAGPQASAPPPSEPQASGPPTDQPPAHPTHSEPQAGDHATADPQPAETAPTPPTEPGFLARGNIRRRARFLRAARELAYRDLGGLVFDLHRFGEQGEDVLAAKLATLGRIDAELRALEEALKRRTPLTVLRRAGVSACPRCAAIHGSFDRFCPACGLPVRPDARPIAPPAGAQPPAAIQQPVAPPSPIARPPATNLPTQQPNPPTQQPTQAFSLPGDARSAAPPTAAPPHAPSTGETPSSSRAEAAAPRPRAAGEDGETEVIGPRRGGSNEP